MWRVAQLRTRWWCWLRINFPWSLYFLQLFGAKEEMDSSVSQENYLIVHFLKCWHIYALFWIWAKIRAVVASFYYFMPIPPGKWEASRIQFQSRSLHWENFKIFFCTIPHWKFLFFAYGKVIIRYSPLPLFLFIRCHSMTSEWSYLQLLFSMFISVQHSLMYNKIQLLVWISLLWYIFAL